MSNDKVYGEVNYAKDWDGAFEKRDAKNNQPNYTKEDVEKHLNTLAINSTKKGKKSRKSLLDFLNTKKGKTIAVTVLSAIILWGTSLTLLSDVTKNKRTATGICKEKMITMMEENGVIVRDGNIYNIANLDNLSMLELDSEEDLYIALITLEGASNYNSIADGYGQYNVNEKTATSTTYDDRYYYTSYDQVLSHGGYYDEQGNTSSYVFRNYKEAKLEEMYKEGTLEEYLEDTLGPGTKGVQR